MIMIRAKQKVKSWWKKKFGNYFTEYCNKTSIHGFKYIGERKVSIPERVCWFLIIMTLTFICFVVTLQGYLKWKQSPVIVSLESHQVPILNIPFPAVTICPQNKFEQTQFNISDIDFENLNEIQRQELEYAALICNINDGHQNINYTSEFVNNSALDFLDKVVPNLRTVFKTCSWNGRQTNCEELFTPILTDEGICFTFNMVNRNELYTDAMTHYKSYQNHSHIVQDMISKNILFSEQYPKRSSSSGAESGLEVTLVDTESDFDHNCGIFLKGYKVLLHSPDELPQVKRHFFHVPLNYLVHAAVTPNIISTSERFKSYEPIERGCYFNDQKQIHFFKSYTQKNCQLELLSNLTYNFCGCVAYYMTRNSTTPICGPKRQHCLNQAKEYYLDEAVDIEIKRYLLQIYRESEYNFLLTIYYICDLFMSVIKGEYFSIVDYKSPEKEECLPSCTLTTYSTEITQSIWRRGRRKDRESNKRLSKLEIYFKDDKFTSSKKNEIYISLRDFLSSCGGLLSLFTGFSIVSLIEIIYFLTFRWMLRED